MDYSHSPRANATASLTPAGSSKFTDGQRLLVIHRRRNAVYAEISKLVKLRSRGRSCASAKASASLQQVDHLPVDPIISSVPEAGARTRRRANYCSRPPSLTFRIKFLQ